MATLINTKRLTIRGNFIPTLLVLPIGLALDIPSKEFTIAIICFTIEIDWT